MLRVKDARSLLGGIALVITGVTLTLMVYLYFSDQYTGAQVFRARWLWEIILNLQILCVAFMWFCYAERIRDPDKRKAHQMIVRMGLSLFAVLLPAWVGLVSVSLGWFVELPSREVIDKIFIIMVGYWLLSVLIPRWLALVLEEKKPGSHLLVRRLRANWGTLPFITAMVILAIDMLRGTHHYYLAIPTLFYTQAAVPYLQSGFKRERDLENNS